jgi:hypothetical protein
MTEQAKGERCACGGWSLLYAGDTIRIYNGPLAWWEHTDSRCGSPTPPPAPEPAKAKDCRCASVMDGRGGMCPAHPCEPAPGPAKGGEARVEYAEGMMYPWRVIQGLEEDGETPNCVASLREKSVAEFVTGLINERAQLRAANEALREREQHLEPAKAKDCRCASVMDGRGGMCPAHPTEPAPGPAKGHYVDPARTHCDGCGLSWLDDGLNPTTCPYCALDREKARADGLEQQIRGAIHCMAVLIWKAGGEIRISKRDLIRMDPNVEVVRYEEPAPPCDTVFMIQDRTDRGRE